ATAQAQDVHRRAEEGRRSGHERRHRLQGFGGTGRRPQCRDCAQREGAGLEIPDFRRLCGQGNACRSRRGRARQEVRPCRRRAGRGRSIGGCGMDRSWYWKAGLIVLVALGAVYALVPTWTYFQLPADQRNEAGVFEQRRPGWAPKRHLNLGLDLQGGIHLVMGVEVDRAVREKAVRRAEELALDFDRRGIKGVDVKGDPDTGIVTVTGNPDAVSKAKDEITTGYTDMYVR